MHRGHGRYRPTRHAEFVVGPQLEVDGEWWSNGATEAVDLLSREKARRTSPGVPTHENCGLRLLLRGGIEWHTASTVKIPGRHLRSRRAANARARHVPMGVAWRASQG